MAGNHYCVGAPGTRPEMIDNLDKYVGSGADQTFVVVAAD